MLCDLTQGLFMPHDPAYVCVCARARSCVQGRVKSGLCYMITGLSLFSLHTSASLFFCPSFPSFNTLRWNEVLSLLSSPYMLFFIATSNRKLLDVAHIIVMFCICIYVLSCFEMLYRGFFSYVYRRVAVWPRIRIQQCVRLRWPFTVKIAVFALNC